MSPVIIKVVSLLWLYDSQHRSNSRYSGTFDDGMTNTQSVDELVKVLKTKAELLRLTNEETKGIISKAKISELERQRKTLYDIDKFQEVHEIKVRIQEGKLGEGINAEDVRTWTEKIKKDDIAPIEAVLQLETVLENVKQDELRRREGLAAQAREEKAQEQLKYDKEKFELQFNYEKELNEEREKLKSIEQGSQKPNVRLQKLQITKSDRTYTDWIRFWSQFEAEIHAADIPAVTKFSYLKELVVPKVRISIQGLPFATEGYERAKNILKTRYGKSSEIINNYIQNIMSLPNVSGCQPSTLMYNVQSLETMGKLSEVNGYVRTTIDKLEGIRGDLVRMDDDWQGWKFPNLVEALRKWTERNPIKNQRDNPLPLIEIRI